MEAWLLARFDAESLDHDVSKMCSLDLLEIAYEIEEAFHVELDFTTFPKTGTLRDILNLILEKQRGN